MSEADQQPTYERLVVEVPAEQKAAIIDVVSQFALTRQVDVRFPEAASQQPADVQRFRPDRVTWMRDSESDDEVPVILPSHLRSFAEETFGLTVLGTRIETVFLRRNWTRKGTSLGATLHYFLMCDAHNQPVGLRADRLGELVQHFEERGLEVARISDRSVELLRMYRDNLLTEES